MAKLAVTNLIGPLGPLALDRGFSQSPSEFCPLFMNTKSKGFRKHLACHTFTLNYSINCTGWFLYMLHVSVAL